MTAVRRVDQNRSPMLKVMDLFRHRSNSAVSEADKRKAVSHLKNILGLHLKLKFHYNNSKFYGFSNVYF